MDGPADRRLLAQHAGEAWRQTHRGPGAGGRLEHFRGYLSQPTCRRAEIQPASGRDCKGREAEEGRKEWESFRLAEKAEAMPSLLAGYAPLLETCWKDCRD